MTNSSVCSPTGNDVDVDDFDIYERIELGTKNVSYFIFPKFGCPKFSQHWNGLASLNEVSLGRCPELLISSKPIWLMKYKKLTAGGLVICLK